MRIHNKSSSSRRWKCLTADNSCYDLRKFNHGLRGSASPVLTATGFVNGRWQFSTPHRISTPWPITKKFGTGDYVGGPYGCAKFGADPSMGGFWANRWNITKIFYLFIPLFSWTHLQVIRDDGFSRLMAQTTQTRARMCLLGVSLTLLPILGVKSPETPTFWGVNRRFQAKRAKYWKFHVIETTASISTKFCRTIETIKKSSCVVPVGAEQIQDGGRPPFWKKPLNRYISKTVWPILIRFGTVKHIGLLQRIYS